MVFSLTKQKTKTTTTNKGCGFKSESRMRTYTVYDKYNNRIKGGFKSYKAAFTYLIALQRYDYIIKEYNYGRI